MRGRKGHPEGERSNELVAEVASDTFQGQVVETQVKRERGSRLEKEPGLRTGKASWQRSGLCPRSTKTFREDYEIL